MPLAVLGGSFDPVHCGHVEMAEHILKCGLARKIQIVPAFISPFKSKTNVSPEHRLAMTQLAFPQSEKFEVDDREIRRQGSSFMIETLEELHQLAPQRPLRLIIGADNVKSFFQWHRADDILSLAQVLVLGRHGYELNLGGNLSSSFILAPGFDQRVSSTEIRAILASRQPVGDRLPTAVARYIQDNDLYR